MWIRYCGVGTATVNMVDEGSGSKVITGAIDAVTYFSCNSLGTDVVSAFTNTTLVAATKFIIKKNNNK